MFEPEPRPNPVCWALTRSPAQLPYIHPGLFLHSEQANRLATRVAGAFSPCLYCAQPRAHPRQHLSTCIPLWQVCVFALFHGHGSDGGAVRASPGQAPNSVNIATQRRDLGETSQNRQTQCRQRQPESGIPGGQSTLSGLWRGIRSAARGKPAGSDPGAQAGSGGYIHREKLSHFHATKKLEEGMEGETVRLIMDVAFRAPEPTLCPSSKGVRRYRSQASSFGKKHCSDLLLCSSSWLFARVAAADRHHTEAQASSCRCGLTTAGLQAYRFLRSLPPRPRFLPGMLLWGILFGGWVRAHAQHDCAEFMAFVAARLCPSCPSSGV